MDVILHVGAHRTGTTSFQRYMRDASSRLGDHGVAFWGPGRTRKGLFHGLACTPHDPRSAMRARGRVQLNLARARTRGAVLLVVSDENMIGTPRDNLRCGALYPGIGQRMARFGAAFDGRVSRVVLQIRALDAYWASLMAYGLTRGAPLPDAAQRARIAAAERGWRAVISDLACALPEAEIRVLPCERFADRPDRTLDTICGARVAPPARSGQYWVNRAPDLPALRHLLADRGEDPTALPPGEGRWQPFTPAEAAALRARHAEDLAWLRAGADGLARLTEESEPDRARTTWPQGLTQRGHDHDSHTRRLAHAR